MKNIFVLLLASLMGMANIAAADDLEGGRFDRIFKGLTSSVYVFTDLEQGCQYLVYINGLLDSVNMVPRLGSDGKPICIDSTKPEAESFK